MGNTLTLHFARQALTWSAVALAIVVASWNTTPLFGLPVFCVVILGLVIAFLVVLWVAIMNLNGVNSWRRVASAAVNLVVFFVAFIVLTQFEDSIHFVLLQPLYRLEVAFAKPGPEGYMSRTWHWAEALNFGTGVVLYNNKPNAMSVGATHELNCGSTTRELGGHFYLVRTVCWS